LAIFGILRFYINRQIAWFSPRLR